MQCRQFPRNPSYSIPLLRVMFAKCLKCLHRQFDLILISPQGSGFLIIHTVHVLLLAAVILVNYFSPKGNAGWHSWQTSQLQTYRIGCALPRLGLLLYATAVQHSLSKPASLSSPLQTLRPSLNDAPYYLKMLVVFLQCSSISFVFSMIKEREINSFPLKVCGNLNSLL